MRQPVVVDFMHEREQATDLTGGDALTGKPVQVVSLLAHQQTPFVLAKGCLLVTSFWRSSGFMGSAALEWTALGLITWCSLVECH
jgi:hypothetical protein